MTCIIQELTSWGFKFIPSVVANSIIGWGGVDLFIYSCLQTIKTINFKKIIWIYVYVAPPPAQLPSLPHNWLLQISVISSG